MSDFGGPVDAATETFDAVDSPQFFVRGRGGLGRPRVHVYHGDRSRVVVGNLVTIGDDVDFVVGGNHRTDWVTTYPIQEMYDLPDAYVDSVWSKGETHVEHGVSIGRGAKVMPGVRIGLAAHVLPYSVVTRDVAAGAIVLGSPAREVGRRFEPPVLDALRHVDWDASEPELARQIAAATGHDAHAVIAALAVPAVPADQTPSTARSTARDRGWAARDRTVVAALRERLARATLSALGRSKSRMRDFLRPGGAGRASVSRGGTVADDGLATERMVRGHGSYGRPTIEARAGAPYRLVIGRFCSIAKGCEVLLDADAACRGARVSARGADVTVGNDVWLGMGVKLYPGVTIGDGAVAAAWSVVVDDVPPYAIVAGNPARVVRARFDESTIAALLRIRWWEWPDAKVVANWRALCSDDLATFVAAHDPARVQAPPPPAPPQHLLPRSASA